MDGGITLAKTEALRSSVADAHPAQLQSTLTGEGAVAPTQLSGGGGIGRGDGARGSKERPSKFRAAKHRDIFPFIRENIAQVHLNKITGNIASGGLGSKQADNDLSHFIELQVRDPVVAGLLRQSVAESGAGSADG